MSKQVEYDKVCAERDTLNAELARVKEELRIGKLRYAELDERWTDMMSWVRHTQTGDNIKRGDRTMEEQVIKNVTVNGKCRVAFKRADNAKQDGFTVEFNDDDPGKAMQGAIKLYREAIAATEPAPAKAA